MIRPLVVCLLAGSSVLAAQSGAPPTVAGWRADLQALAKELPARHPAPFLNITSAQWDSAVASVNRRLPTLNQDQTLVAFFQLVALAGDAHTTVQPDPARPLHFYPIELYAFEDGLFVRRADSAHASLVGARVVRFGNASAEEAMARVATIIPHENDWWVRAWGPFWLTAVEMVHGLGLTTDPNRLTLVVERHGRQETVTLAPAGTMAHGEGGAVDMSHWVSMRAAAAPLSEQQPGNPFWWTWLPDSRTLYVSLRAVVPAPNSATNRSQWNQVFALADSLQPARLVLDIRDNLGGNGGLNRYPVQQIVRRPWLDRPDRLFVIIGRRTFSAGQQFANLLEAWTQATFVGEPTGQRPSQYGDHRPLELPNSHLTVMISTVFHQAPDEFDRREFVPPDAYAPLTSEAYRSGQDPAMAATLSWKAGPAVAESVAALVAVGDSAGAERLLRSVQQQPINRYRSLEAEINALGYRLLGGGSAAQAVTVFRINTLVYPHSANAFDSLGEALLTSGQRDAGIAAYRQALRIEPGFPPSQQALQRLGVQ
ncbi:MAG TPA: S41 family peptidase [Gemmatimonadales bacterium]|nr:S41 family peptidase [Gemmatimonadales bacterium]